MITRHIFILYAHLYFTGWFGLTCIRVKLGRFCALNVCTVEIVQEVFVKIIIISLHIILNSSLYITHFYFILRGAIYCLNFAEHIVVIVWTSIMNCTRHLNQRTNISPNTRHLRWACNPLLHHGSFKYVCNNILLGLWIWWTETLKKWVIPIKKVKNLLGEQKKWS